MHTDVRVKQINCRDTKCFKNDYLSLIKSGVQTNQCLLWKNSPLWLTRSHFPSSVIFLCEGFFLIMLTEPSGVIAMRSFNLSTPQSDLLLISPLQFYPCIKCKGKYHKFRKILIVKQIFMVTVIGNGK